MNNNYYPNSNYQGNLPTGNYLDNTLEMEQSYIENILRLNKGKYINAYFSFPDSTEWRNKVYSGTLKEAGKDHIIIENRETGRNYLILMIYLNYVEFNEPINYNHAYSEKNF